MRLHQPVSLHQAAMGAPILARLVDMSRESSLRLKTIEGLLPGSLRTGVEAGPIEGSVWCLLVRGNAVAAKLRQLLPALEAHLRSKGFEVTSIRMKIQTPVR